MNWKNSKSVRQKFHVPFSPQLGDLRELTPDPVRLSATMNEERRINAVELGRPTSGPIVVTDPPVAHDDRIDPKRRAWYSIAESNDDL